MKRYTSYIIVALLMLIALLVLLGILVTSLQASDTTRLQRYAVDCRLDGRYTADECRMSFLFECQNMNFDRLQCLEMWITS
jgi:hypothetical protein